jgi:RNA polymerase sigma-70 factor (ECF subfamily)
VRATVERESFAAVAERTLDGVHRYLVFLTGDQFVAEELTATTFERAFRAWRRYDPRRASAFTWLCRLARNVALDHFRAEERRRRREQVYARRLQESEEPSFSEGLSPELERGLDALAPAEREVIALRVVLELDGRDAARVLGISQTACSTRLSRALKKLEETMRDV